MAVDEAILLVGGLGTRLRAVVADVPKPLAPVAGRPFLAWVLDALAARGMRRIVLATGHGAGQVQAAIGAEWKGMTVVHSVEDAPLGTGGAVRHALRLIEGEGTHVLNGDTFLDYDPRALEAATRAANACVGVALAHVDDAGRYGSVDVHAGRVVAFREKGGSAAGWINAGCYFLTREAIDTLPTAERFSLETDWLPARAAAGDIAAFEDTRAFIDIGVPEDFARAQGWFAQ
jgi:D-glycero-alpha-D-manno-heptose 1-phosphate guanylyltransferase